MRSGVVTGSLQSIVQKNIENLDILISDSTMRQIIYRRWDEICNCVESAPLACVVMVGALLEAFILARINKLDDKSVVFKLKSAPIDLKSKKALNLTEWTLSNYIAVSHEMGWIRKSAKDVSVAIMEYRNLIHPEKQWRLNVILEPQDSRIFFTIFNELSKQIIESVKN